MNTTHDLKTWPVYWEAIAEGRKPFEVRKNDRNYQVGDTLRLHWFDPEKVEFNGGLIEAEVTYMLAGPAFGIEAGTVVLGIPNARVVYQP
jgi:ASC-1-like (ASCH) protein